MHAKTTGNKNVLGLFETFLHWKHSSQDNGAAVNEVGDRREQTQRNNSEGDFWASVATSKTLKVESYLPGKSHVRDFGIKARLHPTFATPLRVRSQIKMYVFCLVLLHQR